MRCRLFAALVLLGSAAWAPALLCATQSGASAEDQEPMPGVFSLDEVADKAARLAQEPFEDPSGAVPDWLLDIDYDHWRDIRFRREAALWREQGLPFQVELFHPGFIFNRVVRVNLVNASGTHPVRFSQTQFDYGSNDFASKVPDDLGYAGLRIRHPIKSMLRLDEVVVFLGATYFRAIGRDQRFGLSARAIAIDTALPSGEEFPHFREFWLLEPAADATSLTLYALLDSPSLTGACRFVITPGAQTSMRTSVRLFRRKEVRKLGVAPLTAMFFFGENSARRFEDFRPEVHDSDGLLVARTNGQWLWQPLDNPQRLQVTALPLSDLAGFGLVQRDRDFDHYQDLEARYEERPSAWISPRGPWGKGRVELVEIPVDSEYHDNIVAYWVPESVPPEGEPVSFAYDIHWYGAQPHLSPLARVVATRRERRASDGTQRFVIDFEGQPLEALEERADVRAVITLDADGNQEGVLEEQVYRNAVTGGWRLAFRVPAFDSPRQLRAHLVWQERPVTETWRDVLAEE